MLLGPDEMALRIQHRHPRRWVVWFGRHTREYWAMARWARDITEMFNAADPDALDAAITSFELLHPAQERQHSHAVANRSIR